MRPRIGRSPLISGALPLCFLPPCLFARSLTNPCPFPLSNLPNRSIIPGTVAAIAGAKPTCGSCPTGWVGDGIDCSDTDECVFDPCFPGTNCSNYPGGFTCGAEFVFRNLTALDGDSCYAHFVSRFGRCPLPFVLFGWSAAASKSGRVAA